MQTIYFKCTLLSSIVLNAKSASEGVQDSLDYIPGANFLGIVAREYDKFDAETQFEIFHSGKVRFGDANPSNANSISYKMPAAWYIEKGGSITDKIYINHLLNDTKRAELISMGKQLKQIRRGFFINGSELINVKLEKQFMLKSAFDANLRKSKDGQLFGYEALKKNSVFTFKVDCDSESLADLLKDKLIGIQQIGRSKTAQYGLIKIEALEKPDEILTEKNSKRNVLYAYSDLAFIDKYAVPTLQPCAQKDLKLPEGYSVDYSASQIRSRSYAPYNGKRRTSGADRVVIEKGSVIVLNKSDDAPPIDTNLLMSGIGLYRAEGLGQVLLNPPFLCEANDAGVLSLNIAEDEHAPTTFISSVVNEDVSDYSIVKLINTYAENEQSEGTILKVVNSFIAKYAILYKEISPSQWGGIRNIAKTSSTKDQIKSKLFDGDSGYLSHGISKDLWDQKGRASILKKAIDNKFSDFANGHEIMESQICNLVEKLAAHMQKKRSKL